MSENFYTTSQNLHLSKINCDVKMIHFEFEMTIVICMLLLFYNVKWFTCIYDCEFLKLHVCDVSYIYLSYQFYKIYCNMFYMLQNYIDPLPLLIM